MIERRKEPRSGIAVPVYFISLGTDGREADQDVATVVNISESGLLMESTVPILVKEIKITAALKPGESLEVYAELVYSIRLAEDQFRSGFMLKGDPHRIDRFVRALSKAASSQ